MPAAHRLPRRLAAAAALAALVAGCGAHPPGATTGGRSAAPAASTSEDQLLDKPLPMINRPSLDDREQPRVSAVAGAIAGRTVHARCLSSASWAVVTAGERLSDGELDGLADPPRDSIALSPDVCGVLDRILYDRYVPSGFEPYADALAVGVLAHEAMHIRRPGASEAQVECAALQRVVRTSLLLHLPLATGRMLARSYERDVMSQDDKRYLSPQCRPGGRLDETPGDGVWP